MDFDSKSGWQVLLRAGVASATANTSSQSISSSLTGHFNIVISPGRLCPT